MNFKKLTVLCSKCLLRFSSLALGASNPLQFMLLSDIKLAGTNSAVTKKMDGLPGDVFPARTTFP